MNAAVAFACVIVLMLAGTAVAVFTGLVDPLPAASQAAQEMRLRDLALSVFVVGAMLLAWRTSGFQTR